jgi:hypothetical protein
MQNVLFPSLEKKLPYRFGGIALASLTTWGDTLEGSCETGATLFFFIHFI